MALECSIENDWMERMQPEEKNSGFQLVPGANCSRKEIHIDCRVLTSLAKLAGFIVAQGKSSNFSCHLLHSAHHGYHGRAIVAQVCCGVVRCVSSPVSLREIRHPLNRYIYFELLRSASLSSLTVNSLACNPPALSSGASLHYRAYLCSAQLSFTRM